MGIVRGLARKAFGWLGGDEVWSGLVWAPSVIPVRENDARSNSIVMACVYWGMRNVGQASPVVQKWDGGDWVTVADHPLAELLRSPQAGLAAGERSRLSGRKLLGALVYSRMLDGNGYLLKIRNRSGRVIGLDWLPHGSVRAVARRERPGVADFYEVSTPGGVVRVPVDDMVHDMDGIDPANPVSGLGRLKCLMRQVMTDNQIAAYCQSMMRSPVPSLMVSVKSDGTKITQEDADYIAQRIQEKSSGEKAGAGKLEEGWIRPFDGLTETATDSSPSRRPDCFGSRLRTQTETETEKSAWQKPRRTLAVRSGSANL